jgi:hypothetical protein
MDRSPNTPPQSPICIKEDTLFIDTSIPNGDEYYDIILINILFPVGYPMQYSMSSDDALWIKRNQPEYKRLAIVRSKRLKKAYYRANIQHIKDYKKMYCKDNKKEIDIQRKKWASTKVTCECGITVCRVSLKSHKRSLIHISELSENKSSEEVDKK